jgi:DNA-binding transcriptional regulator YbjK
MRANPCLLAGDTILRLLPRHTMISDRKTLIADAAIALLARLGARGLTHRAVDQHAGLPPGSTSFYCRSRLDLLSLALVRHGSLDMADLEADAHALAAHVGGDPLSLFIDSLAARIDAWLSPEGRDRMVARFELFLIASHEPELTPVVQAQRQRFRDAATAALRGLGLPDAQALAPALLMTVDGILLAHVAHSDTPLARAQVRAMLRRAVTAGQADAG